MQCVTRHGWPNEAKAQVRLSKAGQCQFSHSDGIPINLSVQRQGLCKRRITAVLLENIWFRDAVSMVTIPKGFTWDLASIPPILWNLLSPEELAYESAFHDANYREQKVTKEYADFQFRYLMKARGKPWYIRWTAWAAVALFGGKAWEHNRKKLERRNARKKQTSSPSPHPDPKSEH